MGSLEGLRCPPGDSVGFVFQALHLVPTLTVRENAHLRLSLNGLDEAHHRARADELLAEVGLADRADEWPDRLSGGEQQRIAIVAALVHDPDLVLADEPTGSLDRSTGDTVLDLLDRLTRRMGKTLIVATHSTELAQRADRVVEIRDRGIVEVER